MRFIKARELDGTWVCINIDAIRWFGKFYNYTSVSFGDNRQKLHIRIEYKEFLKKIKKEIIK